MSSEIIQNVTYDNYGDFQTCPLHIFHKISFHYFEDYLIDETDLRLRYCTMSTPTHFDKVSLTKQGVRHIVALPFALKSILRQKKNYGNSNIIFEKNPVQETKIL
jgi:hypothetical protein